MGPGKSMGFKKIVVAGGGVLGSQIAYQSAFKGFDVTIWLRSYSSIGRCQPKLERLHEIYMGELKALKDQIGKPNPVYSRGLVDDFTALTPEKVDELIVKADKAYKAVKLVVDLNEAMEDADLVIESMAENPDQKIEFYEKIRDVLPAKTVLVTNSSTMLPSTFAEHTGRPEKYLALHFANEIWRNNTGEVMGHPGTDQKAYDQVVEFVDQIGMVPLCLKKEQPGYILNSMLVPFLDAAQTLLAKEVADPETIDKTWKLATGAPAGPFQILDVVGLTTAYNITMNNPAVNDPDSIPAKIAAILKKYIDEGKTGVNAGEGFYKYK